MKYLVNAVKKITAELLRDKDRLIAVTPSGNKIRFTVKESGSQMFIFVLGEDKPVAQLGPGEKDIKHAENDLLGAKLIKRGTLEIRN